MGRAPYVVNPATRRWEAIPWKDPKDANPHLVFDPAASPHYEVFLIPHGPKEVVLSSPAHQRLDKSVNLRQFAIQSKGNKHGRPDLMEWPPSLWTLNVFSSRTREWQTRPFVREVDDDDDDDDDDEVESVEVEVKVEEQEDEDDDKVGYGVQQENNETVTSEVSAAADELQPILGPSSSTSRQQQQLIPISSRVSGGWLPGLQLFASSAVAAV
ncbi:hypothetical protein ACQ4PT_059328 [Festuca glaucescens]